MAVGSVISAVLLSSGKSVGPSIAPFFSDQPCIKVVITELLWLDSGPSLLTLLCFLSLPGVSARRWLLPLGGERAQCVLRGVSWHPLVPTQVSYTTPNNALTWSVCCSSFSGAHWRARPASPSSSLVV